MRPVIAFAGLIGSGKSTAAAHLAEEHRFRRVRFAGALKDMMRAIGLSEREIEGDLKERPCQTLGYKTPRFAMQTIGTEWGRNTITPDLWTRVWTRAADQVPEGVGIVAEDVRFANEYAAVKAYSPFALVVRIERPECGDSKETAHVSELQAFPADVTIVNDGSVSGLLSKVDELLISRMTAVPAM